MIHGYHLILPAYGFWLPNDPRGSWSDMVRKWELVRFGPATKNIERRTLDSLSESELASREAARKALTYPPVAFSDEQIAAIAEGFARRASKSNYTVWACAILPEHTHLVLARHIFIVEKLANQLKGAATRTLLENNIHPLAHLSRTEKRLPRMWAENQWKVYLDSEQAIENAIHYVEDNPMKEGLPKQDWPFVQPFAGITRGAWTTYH